MNKKVVSAGLLNLNYEIIEEDGKKRLEIKSKKLPDDFYNAYLSLDVKCNTNCLGISHDIDPKGDWLISIIDLK